MTKPSVLITAAGGAGTIEVLKSLAASRRYRLIALDASPHAAGFSFADESRVVPFAADPAFRPRVAEILEEERPDFIVPLVDEEILLFHDLAAASPRPVQVVAPREAFCKAALDKWETFLALEKAGVPTAKTALADAVRAPGYPAVVKPRDGRGSRELAYLKGKEDLDAYLDKASRRAGAYVLQERLEGTEFTVSAVVALGGPLLTVVPKEVVVKKGITQVGVTREVPAIDRLCRDIQERLKADGPFNVQLILTAEGTPKVIEINPRYSTTVALTLAAGVDEVDLVLRRALGEKPAVPRFRPDLLMIRHPAHLYIPESEWPPRPVETAGAPGRPQEERR